MTVEPITWDTKALGIECFELNEASNEALKKAITRPGHYTVKVDPLASKEGLHRNGFYYCDTLIEPHCGSQHLIDFKHPKVAIQRRPDINQLIPICRGAFRHDRFHRDFNVGETCADQRYVNWLKQLDQDRGV